MKPTKCTGGGPTKEITTLWRSFSEIKQEMQNSNAGSLGRVSDAVYDAIVGNLVYRIERIDDRHRLRFVPFGNVARRSLRRAQNAKGGLLQDLSVSDVQVWHPSAWRSKENLEKRRESYRSRDEHLRSVALDVTCYLTRQ